MSSTGFDNQTGALLTDFDHVRQSVGVILGTLLATRVMERDFGSTLPELIDRPMTNPNLLKLYSASAEAISKWEPRYAVSKFSFSKADESGKVEVSMIGTYYPNGHKGDFSTSENGVLIKTKVSI